MTVYVVFFEVAIGGTSHTASTYVGYCQTGNLRKRLNQHGRGRSNGLFRAAKQRGIGFYLAAVFPEGTRELERQIKSYKHTRRWLQVHVPILRRSDDEIPNC